MTDIPTDFANALASKFAKKEFEKKANKVIIGDKEYELVNSSTKTNGKISFGYADGKVFKISIDDVTVYLRELTTDWSMVFDDYYVSSSYQCSEPFNNVTTIVWDNENVQEYNGKSIYHNYGVSGEHTVRFIGKPTFIGENAFLINTSLKKIVMNNEVTEIRKSAFDNCTGLQSITFSNSLEQLGERVFAYCSALTSLSFPNSLQSIDSQCFQSCSNLNTVVFGTGLTSIGVNAFTYCTGIKNITFKSATPPSVRMDAFFKVSGATIKVPSASLNAYKNTANMPSTSTNTYVGY